MADVAAVAAPIVRVELFEDRAAVTRSTTLGEGGRHRLRIGPVSAVVSERGITFPGTPDVTVEDVRVERVMQTRQAADPEQVSALDRSWRSASERAERTADGLKRATERVARHTAALAAAQAAAARGLVEHDEPGRWIDAVSSLAESVRDGQVTEAAERAELALRQEEVARLAAKLAEARRGKPVYHAFIDLSVLAERPGPLVVRYVIPCAVWRPSHRATLTTERGAPRVAWQLGAVCWNATGEDWDGVELVCSTARPGDLAEPPRLDDDVIQIRKRAVEVIVEAREEAIQVARERTGGRRSTGEDVPGVDDGGEPRTFTAEGPVVLRSDGKPVTVPLGAWSSEATARWLLLPERSGSAVLRSIQHNQGTRPILAGPVELVRDGMTIGVGRVGLVAPGEPFPLGFGTHDGVSARRRRQHQVDRTRITGRQWHTFTVDVHVTHLGSEPCRVEVRERLPTSELKEVNVSKPKAEPALDAPIDRDGFVRWTLELAPGDTRHLKLEYTVDAASNVRLPY